MRGVFEKMKKDLNLVETYSDKQYREISAAIFKVRREARLEGINFTLAKLKEFVGVKE